jgi:hypothetical protein
MLSVQILPVNNYGVAVSKYLLHLHSFQFPAKIVFKRFVSDSKSFS